MNDLLASSGAHRLAWTLLHSLWQGAIIGLAAALALRLLRHARPQARYLAACLGLLGCLLAPLVTFAVLGVPTGLPAPSLATGSPTAPLFLAEAGTPLILGPRPGSFLDPWLPRLVVAWAAGVLLFGLRALGAWAWLQRLRSSATPETDARSLQTLADLSRRLDLRRPVRLLASLRVNGPLALGILRPAILVPTGFLAQLDPLALEAVLAHELAHLRRLDPLVNGLQALTETLLFYHPAVGWLSRRMRTEREHCCDDDAIQACGDAVGYAETLSRLDALRGRPLSLAPGARGGHLMERIRRLLLKEPAPLRFAWPGLTLVGLGLATTLLMAQEKTPKAVKKAPAAQAERAEGQLPPPPPAPAAAPAPKAPPAPPAPPTAEAPVRRQIAFWHRKPSSEGVRLQFNARNATRGEVLEALTKIQRLSKGELTPSGIRGEWRLPSRKDLTEEQALTFEVDGVTLEALRELYQ